MSFEITVQRLVDIAKGGKPRPVHIHLDTTNRCNLKCLFCWQRSHERMGILDLKNELPDEKLLQTVDEAASLGVAEWLISGGGEPFVRTRLCMEVMERIKTHGMFGDIITNGTILGEKRARRLVEIGWDRFRVSINGAYAEEHDRLTNKKGAFDRAVGNIKLINKYKKRLKTDKPEIGFNTAINVYSHRRFSDIIGFLHELGGQIINTQTIILYDENEKKYTLTAEQQAVFKEETAKAIELARKWNIHTNLSSYFDDGILSSSNEMAQMDRVFLLDKAGFENAHCFEPFYLMCIRANGIVGSCRLFGDSGVSLHDRGLKEVWFGEYMENARRRIIENKMPEYCRYCGANEVVDNRLFREELGKRLERKRGPSGRNRRKS